MNLKSYEDRSNALEYLKKEKYFFIILEDEVQVSFYFENKFSYFISISSQQPSFSQFGYKTVYFLSDISRMI
jgi:hypothetical protein